jgi:AAA domain-containing protein
VGGKAGCSDTCQTLKIDGLQGFPHGAAWQFLRENFDLKIMARLNALLRRGLHVVVIGHAQVRTVQLPGSWEPFERFEPRLDRRIADSLVEWSDCTLFFDWDLRTAKNRDGVVRAIAGHEPVIRVAHGPGWIAKNRSGLTGALKCEFASIAPLLDSVTAHQEPRPGARSAPSAPAAPAALTSPPTLPPSQHSRTNQPVADPDEAAFEPFLSDQERQSLDAFLSSLPQEQLFGFLRERGLIHENQGRHMLGPQYSRRILADPEGFKEAVCGA